MKDLQIVFGIVCKYCWETGISNEQCFHELEKIAPGNLVFFPFYFYLQVLRSLGLIELSKFKREITLTEKGKTTKQESITGFSISFILLLHFIKRIGMLAIMLILFWPMHISFQKADNIPANDEVQRCKG